jgi:MFS family permease
METTEGFWNVLHLGFGFLLLFFAFNTAQALQSEVNENVGIIALGLLYLAFSFSSLFGATHLTNKLSAKYAVAIGGACYIPYLAANIKVYNWVLFICSIINGFGASLLWTGQGVYITQNSNPENQGVHSGVFWGLFQLNSLGNLFSQFIRNMCLERANFYLFLGLTGAAVLGVICLFFLRKTSLRSDSINYDSLERESSVPDIDATGTFRLFFNDKRSMLLAPLFIYVGITVTVYYGTFTSRLNKEWLGFVMTCFGICNSVGSIVAGRVSDTFGRRPIIVFGVLTSVSGMVLANLAGECTDDDPFSVGCTSDPNSLGSFENCSESQIFKFFFAAMLNGFSDGIYNTQVVAIVGDMFVEHTTEAFALSVFMKATTSGIMFFVSLGIGLFPQTCIMLGTLVIAVGCYLYLTLKYRTPSLYSTIK